MVGCHILECVRLVQNRNLVIGQDTRSRPAHRHIAEEQRMVDDQQIRGVDFLPGLEVKTILILRAIFSKAVIAVAFHQVPDRRGGLEIEVAPAAIIGVRGPVTELDKLFVCALFADQRARSLSGHA